MLHDIASLNDDESFIILTASGVFEAFSYSEVDEKKQALQALLSRKTAWREKEWTDAYEDDWLDDFSDNGWIQFLSKPLPAPNIPLDKFLPYVMASLSGNRKAVLGTNEGFALAHTGYTQEEADMLCVAGADCFDFLNRQQKRGWEINEQAFSFYNKVDLLMPTTSFIFLKIGDEGYVLIIDGEPLTNSRAFVELIWGIKTAGLRYLSDTEDDG